MRKYGAGMLKRDIEWFFPESAEEALRFARDGENRRYYASGTGILRTRPSSIHGLIDLGRAGLSYIEEQGDFVSIGSMTVLREILDFNGVGGTAFEALQAWVEEGKAPDQIIYGHSMGGRGGKVYRTRPVCAYPGIAKYKGSGDINDAANFTCVSPED